MRGAEEASDSESRARTGDGAARLTGEFVGDAVVVGVELVETLLSVGTATATFTAASSVGSGVGVGVGHWVGNEVNVAAVELSSA